jgi:translocation and assembly module TamB
MQGNLAGTGSLTLTGRLTGPRASPQLRGAAALANVSFRGSPLPDLRASFQYANTELAANADLLHTHERPLATMSARIPVDMALARTVTGSRLLDKPMRVDLHADSLPLDALPRFTDAVANVQGRVIGAVAARGTPRKPSLAGALALDFASFRVVPMGVTLSDIAGRIRMLGDSISIDSLAGYSGGGTMSLAGGIGIKDPRKPSFALTITGRNALAMNTNEARLHANADIAVRGSLASGADITGRATILDGAIYIPPTVGQQVIGLDDPVMVMLADTSPPEVQKLVPPPSTLLENLRVNVALRVMHDTWVRSPEANVEIYSVGDLGIRVNRARRVLTVEGVMNTDRGDYTYLGRQFVLSHGAVTFSGERELNPLLQINAIRSVELAGRGTLKIQILVAGTMKNPQITLTSDAQPPISQSDLLSYLAFGQSSSSLLQFGGSSGLSGQNTGSGQLVGQAAGIATRQLAAVALDVAAKQAQANAARALGTDVLNITPADIPTDFSLTSVETLLAGTQIEAGKYLSRRTFVAAQVRPTLVAPGFSVEHRMADGYRIEVSLEPRFLLRQPSLSESSNPKPTSVVGAFLVREWRF